MTEPLIEFRNIDVALSGMTVLRDITWCLRRGEHWAICGGNGSGKTTFLKLLRGDVSPVPKKGRRISRLGGIEQGTAVGLKQRVALVSPELQDRYLQQEWRLTVLQVLHSGFLNGDYVYEKPTAAQKQFAAEIAQLVGITDLLSRNVQQLSTGELRKVLIARALVGKPEILALDEASDGLDPHARADFQQTVERIADSGTQLLLATHRGEEMLSCITHALLLENGRITWSGEAKSGRGLPQSRTRWGERPREPECDLEAAREDARPTGLRQSSAAFRMAEPNGSPKTLLCIEGANVFLERKQVLHEINWEIRDDQHWAILGRNGSGKSTLLKLAFGDLYAAWGAKVSRFEFTARNTIWDVRKKIGYVAPDLQAAYREAINGTHVVASGFFATFGLHTRLSPAQRRKVTDLIGSFGLEDLAKKTALQLSYGEFRKLLLLRALVNNPQILICDEPFDGLDPAAKADFAAALDRVAKRGTRLVVVTHHVGEIPDCITHGLLLENGRIVSQGYFEEVRRHPSMRAIFRRV